MNSGRMSKMIVSFEELREAAQRLIDNPPCIDYDCCERGADHSEAEDNLEQVLDKINRENKL